MLQLHFLSNLPNTEYSEVVFRNTFKQEIPFCASLFKTTLTTYKRKYRPQDAPAPQMLGVTP